MIDSGMTDGELLVTARTRDTRGQTDKSGMYRSDPNTLQYSQLTLSELLHFLLHTSLIHPPLYAPSPPAVFVIVAVVVAVFVTLFVLVLVTVVSAGPFVMKHEQADEISLGLPRPREMLIPPMGSVMSIWRLRTGSSAGQETS
jgi:hypothetical protein